LNKKAESFKNYLEANEINAFVIEEVEDDKNETAIFRTVVIASGQRLPAALIIDKSIFSLIRVQIVPQVLSEENKNRLLQFVNEENFRYKPFKFYFNPAGNLLLDVCIINSNEEIDGKKISLIFNVINNYLNDSYRDLMKAIWQDES